jgi:phospholipase/carboxylesterase
MNFDFLTNFPYQLESELKFSCVSFGIGGLRNFMSSYSLGRLKVSHSESSLEPTSVDSLKVPPTPPMLGLRRLAKEASASSALLYVPASYKPDQPAPLLVLYHGAGGRAHNLFVPFQDLADHSGTILLLPESRGATWDVILADFGADVRATGEALNEIFSSYNIDPKKIAIGGFSDGASYALSLGIINGDLFSHILAFSPGFMAAQDFHGSPRIFVSHGTQDQVLRIDTCSARLVPRLRHAGYRVKYIEFEGGHTLPPAILRESFLWWLQPSEQEQDLLQSADVPVIRSEIDRT